MNAGTGGDRSQRGLDWLNFFVANVQTGFGPFISVYLTAEAWTQRDIGYALSIGTIASMVSQLPGGALVDALRNKRLAALAACTALAFSALMFALWPTRLSVILAEILHGFASCMLTPAIAAISLQLVGRGALGQRLGRNARYAAIGSGVAAGLLGACGTYISEESVFYVTAALMIPGMLALRMIQPPARPVPPLPPDAKLDAAPELIRTDGLREVWRLFTDRRLLLFAACVVLFHLSNAAMLPLAAAEVTKAVGSGANQIIAACIIVPQVLLALCSPWVGRAADRWGRRPVLVFGFLALPVRGALLAVVSDPVLLVAVQALDAISAASFGIMMPLIAADLTRGTNRFNLCMGALGLAVGAGATFSTGLAGVVADAYGISAALFCLAGVGLMSVVLVQVAMPETREEVLEAPAPS